jgi:dihydrofolate synthase/folylpolyglutamate synthase
MNLLNHPYKDFKSIHITGTNGKGSTTIKIAAVLEEAGYKTGMYTSPHIFDFMERIQVNRTNLEDEYFAETILRLNEIKKKNSL